MLEVSPIDIKSRFIEFQSLDDSYIDLFIQEASVSIDEAYFRNRYNLAVAYLTAHMLTVAELQKKRALVGDIRREQIEGLEIEYQSTYNPSKFDSSYSSTSYGMKFLEFQQLARITSC